MVEEQRNALPPPVPVKPFVARVLVVDDDPQTCDEIISYLKKDGYLAESTTSAAQALQHVAQQTYHVILIDVFMKGHSGSQLAKLLQHACSGTSLVLLLGSANASVPNDVLRLHSIPCMHKPISEPLLRKKMKEWVAKASRDPANTFFAPERTQGVTWHGIRTRAKQMQDIFARAKTFAHTDANVLIIGESGVGKKLLARAIHNHSRRFHGPFVEVDIAEIPHDRIGMEIFGRESGESVADLHPGRARIMLARGGTLFLEGIELLDELTMAKLLRFLENPSGSSSTQRNIRQWDVRVILATSHRTEKSSLSKARTPLGYLFEQTRPVLVSFPPLRDRKEDILPIAGELLSRYAVEHQKLIVGFSSEAARCLEEYFWPGNISELKRVIKLSVLLCQTHLIQPETLPFEIYRGNAAQSRIISIPVGYSLEAAEREIILKTLDWNQQNKKATSEQLGISRRCLYNKLDQYETVQRKK